MKALTIWQPWASLIVLGEKRYETRGWATRYRGLLAIHAAQKRPGELRRFSDGEGMVEPAGRYLYAALSRHSVMTGDLPHSAILGIVELVDYQPAATIEHNLTDKEKALGDFSWGRFAWRLKVVEVFKQPKPMRGRQGLWTWEEA